MIFKEIYPFRSNFIQLSSGHKMHYLDEGLGGEVVLMVHGNPTWSFYYRELVLGLQDKYRCIVPDHIGCGYSDKPQKYDYCLKNHIKNLSELIQKIKPEKLHLILHDWGGAIGMGVAEEYHNIVDKLVILNTAAFRSKKIPVRISICRIPLLGEFLMRKLNIFARGATKMAVNNPLPKVVKDGYLHPYNSWASRIGIARFVQDIPMTTWHSSYRTLKKVEDNLKSLKNKKMMICWGGRDFCFNDNFYAEWKKRFPHAETHYFKNAGHYILEDKGEIVLEKIKQFL